MTEPHPMARLRTALPFAMSFLLAPLIWFGAVHGGWAVLLIPLVTWNTFAGLDAALGQNKKNADPDTGEADLFWYRVIVLAWAPVQFVTLFGAIWYTGQAGHLGTWEKIGVFFGIGVATGTLGINYSHELMHQKSKLERWMGDLLLAMVLYSHFRSEHLLVHHRYVGTPRDPVTARFDEGFHHFFFRVLRECPVSAFGAERDMLVRKGLHWSHVSNPFWRYLLLQGGMLALAFGLGGLAGVGLFLFQALVAIWQLELVNYVEHYGLTRKHLGEGKYEHVLPRHSWNAAHVGSSWLLINLPRHSDHHYKPSRRFPLLQTYSADEAPQLPYGYPIMTAAAMTPKLWRRMMNKRVSRWRARHYPEITDWSDYNTAATPMPR